MVRLPRPVMIRMSCSPALTACSTTNWMAGLSTMGSISFGCDFVAGRNRVPSPAAGITAFLTRIKSPRSEGRDLGVYPRVGPHQPERAGERWPFRSRRMAPPATARSACGIVPGVQATVGGVRSRVRAEPGKLLVPAGISLTLLGVIGDLVVHSVDASSHAHEQLFVLGLHGNNPWHLVLFAGIFVTAVGAIRWANELGTDAGSLLSAAMSLLLLAAVGLGLVAGFRARTEPIVLATSAGSAGGG